MRAPEISDYLDYRVFLKDLFAYSKVQNCGFSHRFFARKAGFAAPNFLKLVIDGKRNLSGGSVHKIIKGFGLKKRDRDYFEALVMMNQADNHEEKNHYYQKLLSLKQKTPTKKLQQSQYDYFSHWYYPVVREIVIFGDRDWGAGRIAQMLSPSVSVREVEKTLDTLQQLGLIRKDAEGLWEQCDQKVGTDAEVSSLMVANFHRQMIALANESLDRHKAKERDITALTLSIPADKMPQLKKRIALFRRELLDMACEESQVNQVIQVNFQVFPLTQIFKEDAS